MRPVEVRKEDANSLSSEVVQPLSIESSPIYKNIDIIKILQAAQEAEVVGDALTAIAAVAASRSFRCPLFTKEACPKKGADSDLTQMVNLMHKGLDALGLDSFPHDMRQLGADWPLKLKAVGISPRAFSEVLNLRYQLKQEYAPDSEDLKGSAEGLVKCMLMGIISPDTVFIRNYSGAYFNHTGEIHRIARGSSLSGTQKIIVGFPILSDANDPHSLKLIIAPTACTKELLVELSPELFQINKEEAFYDPFQDTVFQDSRLEIRDESGALLNSVRLRDPVENLDLVQDRLARFLAAEVLGVQPRLPEYHTIPNLSKSKASYELRAVIKDHIEALKDLAITLEDLARYYKVQLGAARNLEEINAENLSLPPLAGQATGEF